jgi:hypothetical protein
MNSNIVKKSKKLRNTIPTYKLQNNKINLVINWDSSDKGYSILTSSKMKRFLFSNILQNNNLIQTQFNKPFKVKGKTILHLQAVSIKKWKFSPNWDDIECVNYTDWIKGSPCDIGKTIKMFVKYKSNKDIGGFGSYLIQLFTGEVNLNKHKIFVKTLQKIMKNKLVYIDNEDVEWFHLKQFTPLKK